MSLKGKTALVTGSTSGIGLGIAIELARQGAHIVMNGFGDVDAPRRQIEACGVQTAYHGADMSKPAEIEAMMAFAAEKFGGVDIMVNNAGIQHVSPIESFPTERWDAIIAINLSSAFHTTRLAIPHMKARNWGRIINIASAHGIVASVEKSAYVASKHGLVGLTKVAALELAGSGITCNAICPGWVLTPLVQKQIDEKAHDRKIKVKEAEIELLSEKQPSKQFVTPEQIGKLVAFLCSSGADQITGATQSIDGGWTAQ